MTQRFFAWLIAAVAIALSSTVGATPLSDMAAQMKPGEWRVLNQSGDTSGLSTDLLISCMSPPTGDCADNVLNYADKGLWNPNTLTLYYMGQGHGGRELKFLHYSDASNLWGREAKPYWDCSPNPGCYSMVHGYEHSAIDPATGDIFARRFNSTDVYKWDHATATWSQLPTAANSSIVTALEYFPDAGGLFMVGAGEVDFWNRATNSWSQLSSGLAMGTYHHVASYNPKYKIVVFGGGNGSTKLYRMDANKAITPIQDAPAGVGVFDSVWTVDPASGKYLLLTSAAKMFEYDVPTNTWAQLNTAAVPSDFWASNAYNNAILYRVAVPINTYGLIAFIGFDPVKVWVYKHAPGSVQSLNTSPPARPTGLTVN